MSKLTFLDSVGPPHARLAVPGHPSACAQEASNDGADRDELASAAAPPMSPDDSEALSEGLESVHHESEVEPDPKGEGEPGEGGGEPGEEERGLGVVVCARGLSHNESAAGEEAAGRSRKEGAEEEERKDEHAWTRVVGSGDRTVVEVSDTTPLPTGKKQQKHSFRAPPPPLLDNCLLQPLQDASVPTKDDANEVQARGRDGSRGGRGLHAAEEGGWERGELGRGGEKIATRVAAVVRGDTGAIGIGFKETKCLRRSDEEDVAADGRQDEEAGEKGTRKGEAGVAGEGRRVQIVAVSPGSPAQFSGVFLGV